jgi:hypothetical protein
MSQPNEQTIVDDHRNMLMVSKKISKFQEENLKSWAFLFFENLKEAKVSWNFIKDNENQDFYPGKVEFNLSFNKNTKIEPEKAKKNIDMLTACTKFLFWSETQVIIKKNGKLWKTTKSRKEKTQTSQKKK